MSDDNQIEIPPSFVALFVPPGRIKPTEPRHRVAQRYELCEDMAQMLTEHAKNMEFSLGITGPDVLERCLQGLLTPDSVVTSPEAFWVICRLAELLDWPAPVPSPSGAQSPGPDADA